MNLVKKIYKRLVVGDIKETDDEPNVDEWLEFLDSLPQCTGYISNTYNKYLCRQFHFPNWKKTLFEIAAIPLVIYMLCTRCIGGKNLPAKKGNLLLIERKPDVDYKDIIPSQLLSKYEENMEVLGSGNAMHTSAKMSKEALEIFRPFFRKYWYHPFLILWSIRELCKHSGYIQQYNPAATVVYVEERNVISPMLKQLYEQSGRKFISFMHGEYLLRLIQGYMSFSEYYIWDASYEETFSKILRCDIDDYILYKPHKLVKKWNLEQYEPSYFCTYYFSSESKSSIRNISEVFKKFESRGKKCKVRPHPRYSQLAVIRENFPEEMIEDPKKVSIEESLRATKYVVGLATTVLEEGYYEGREIVIDDIGAREKFENLTKRRYVTLNKPHRLLSELVEAEMDK